MKVTCILPVYNEAATVAKVIETLLTYEPIKELLIVDDGSTDGTSEIIEQFALQKKCRILSTSQNRGKGWAVWLGLKEAKHNLVLLCDSDLTNLQHRHLDEMLTTLKKKKCDMVIAGRDKADGWLSKAQAYISGERVFYKKNLKPRYLEMMKNAGNGVEQIINFAHRGKKVELIISQGIGHLLKFDKYDKKEWLRGYAKELYKIGMTEAKLKTLLLLRRV